MKTSFLDYYKTILSKVRFDRKLFRKEYQKALRLIPADQHAELEEWLDKHDKHRD